MRYSTIWFHCPPIQPNPAKQRIPLHTWLSFTEKPHAIVGSILSWQGKDNAVSTDTKVAITQLNSSELLLVLMSDDQSE